MLNQETASREGALNPVIEAMSDALASNLKRIAPRQTPTPTDLAIIAAPILAAQLHPMDETAKHWSVTTAYALWQEARRFCEALPKKET